MYGHGVIAGCGSVLGRSNENSAGFFDMELSPDQICLMEIFMPNALARRGAISMVSPPSGVKLQRPERIWLISV